MHGIALRPRWLIFICASIPIAVLAGYIAWLVVPIVVQEVVPAVVRAVAE